MISASSAASSSGFTWFDAAAALLLVLFAWHGFQRGLLSWIVGVGAAILSLGLSLVLSPLVAGLFAEQSPWSRIVGERITFLVLLVGLRIILGLALREFVGALRPVLKVIPLVAILDHILGIVPSLVLGICVVLLALLAGLFLPLGKRFHALAEQSYVDRVATAESNVLIAHLPQSGLLADPMRVFALSQQRIHSPQYGDTH